MKNHQFRANKDFFCNAKDKNNKIHGRTKIKEGTIITVLDEEIRNGIRWCYLSHSIGWVGSNNKIWAHLELFAVLVDEE